MRSFLLRARESFWFLPALFGLAAVGLGEGLVTLDRALVGDGAADIAFLGDLSASGGRSILTIIGSSMLTVAGTSFSITISVLATTSSTYGPRLVRNFLADRANQIVLAVFTATFAYALVVLRSVRSPGDSGVGFVPTISIHVAVLGGLVDVAFLVFFIHHIADSVQVTTLQRRVQVDLENAVERIFPAEGPEPSDQDPAVPDPASFVHAVRLRGRSGYVEQIDFVRLVLAAVEHDCVVDVTAMPGAHRIEGEPLVRCTAVEDADAVDRAVRSVFSLGPARTPFQDIRFALQQLVEVAVRGLASGSNDPYTAVTALDLAASALVPLWSRPEAPAELRDDEGRLRVVVHWPQSTALLADVFDAIETYGTEHPVVVQAALGLADRLRTAAPGRSAALPAAVARLRSAALA